MQTLDLRELERLGGLHFNIRRSLSQSEGARRSNRKGRSAEFSGYREYIPGDDMRYVDWNAFARLDKMYIKEYMEEREGKVQIFIDTSRSMDFGEKLKSTLMCEIAEAVSFIASNNKDAVYITNLASGNTMRVPNGNTGTMVLKRWLENITCDGRVNISSILRKSIRGRGGMAFIISDFMDEGFRDSEEDLLRLFNVHDIKVVLVHILSEEELQVRDIGAYEFIDSEDNTRNVRLTLDRQTVADYENALNEYLKKLEKTARAAGAEYILCSTADPLQKIIFENMKYLYTY